MSKYRSEYFPILCAVRGEKNHERGEKKRDKDRKSEKESKSASVFIEFAKNIFVFRVLP